MVIVDFDFLSRYNWLFTISGMGRTIHKRVNVKEKVKIVKCILSKLKCFFVQIVCHWTLATNNTYFLVSKKWFSQCTETQRNTLASCLWKNSTWVSKSITPTLSPNKEGLGESCERVEISRLRLVGYIINGKV